jgi:hypothetical protein
LDGYLAADGIELSDDVLDRVDEIVPPAVTINVSDNMMECRHDGAECSSRPLQTASS